MYKPKELVFDLCLSIRKTTRSMARSGGLEAGLSSSILHLIPDGLDPSCSSWVDVLEDP